MKRSIIHFSWLIVSLALLSSCTKNFDIPGVASLNVFNGVVGTNQLAPDLSENSPIKWYKGSNYVLYGNGGNLSPVASRTNVQFNSYSGTQRFKFFNVPDTLPHSKPLFDLKLELPPGSSNSLFLTGSLQSPDTFFIRDQYPHHTSADSITNIRVINLVSGLTASVNLKDSVIGSEVASLPFKSVSSFRTYLVKGEGTRYFFEIRDATNGTLLTSITANAINQAQGTSRINYYRFKNFTMIIYGALGNSGTGKPSVTIMSNN